MISLDRIRRFSRAQRDFIIAHIDGPVQINVHYTPLGLTRNLLVGLGVLRLVPIGAEKPRFTELTSDGREALGVILGDYADALVAAGMLDRESVFAKLAQWKAGRSKTNPAKSPNLKNSTNPSSSLSDIGR